MNHRSYETILCEYCFEMSPAAEAECPRCGAPLPLDMPVQEAAQSTPGEQVLEEQIEKSHQDLIQAGTSAAELAFGVGCTLGVLIGVVLLVIIFLAITRTWTILALIALILALISFLVSSYLSTRAREATTRATYERQVAPEIDHFISTQGISQSEFNETAAEILPGSSPLLLFLNSQETN